MTKPSRSYCPGAGDSRLAAGFDAVIRREVLVIYLLVCAYSLFRVNILSLTRKTVYAHFMM